MGSPARGGGLIGSNVFPQIEDDCAIVLLLSCLPPNNNQSEQSQRDMVDHAGDVLGVQ
jgi:hypothetical protein